jgi:L-asparaginase II
VACRLQQPSWPHPHYDRGTSIFRRRFRGKRPLNKGASGHHAGMLAMATDKTIITDMVPVSVLY